MKRYNILSLSIAIMLLAVSCYDNDNAITTSMNDVSSRISGLSSPVTGAGATLTINGTQLDGAVRIAFGNLAVPASQFTDISATAITFTVPATAPLSDSTEILVVFPGSDRAFTYIQVIPIPVITNITPAGNVGDVMNIYGNNFDNVTSVSIGGTSATVTSKTTTKIIVTIPAGVTTGKVAVSGPTGTSTSAQQFLACSGAPTDPLCVTPLNLNSGFEAGTGDNFDNWNKANGGTIMHETTSPSEFFNGTRGLKVVRDGTLNSGQWRIQMQTDAVPTVIGADYTVYLWVKSTVTIIGTTQVPAGALRASLSPDTGYYSADSPVTTAWQLITYVVPGAKITTTATKFSLDLNASNTIATTLFIDDVKVIKN